MLWKHAARSWLVSAYIGHPGPLLPSGWLQLSDMAQEVPRRCSQIYSTGVFLLSWYLTGRVTYYFYNTFLLLCRAQQIQRLLLWLHLKILSKLIVDSECKTYVAEGSRVPGASPRLGTLIFKMGIVILVPQSCWKRWLPGGPTVNITLPLIKCQLFIRKISHDLRGWHTYESDTHIGIWQKQKKTLCFMRFILSPPLRVFI